MTCRLTCGAANIMMALVLLAFVLPPMSARADTAAEVKRSEAFHLETISRLKLDRVPFPDALATVRRHWEESHPTEPFPVGLTDYDEPSEFDRPDARITLDAQNVTYFDAVRLIGDLSFHRLRDVRGFVRLKEQHGIVEDWVTQEHALPPAALRGLGLGPDSPPEQVQRALERFGVVFQPGMKATLARSGQVLIVMNLMPQQDRISGIIQLLADGFTISK